MSQLPAADAIARFKANEERIDIFVNDPDDVGFYVTNETIPANVESLPSLLTRFEQRYLTLISRGGWVTATIYSANDLVLQSSLLYVCIVTHTSGTFATDLAAGKWILYQGQYIPRTAAEVTAGVTPVDYTRQPGDVRRYGAIDGGSDSTTAFTNAHASNLSVYYPAGTWNIDTIIITRAGTRVRTDDFGTVLHQRSGTVSGTHIMEIGASNVSVGSMYLSGNIATDTGEQNHAVLVKGAADFSNIRIGDLYGKNIRGDVLYIGGLLTAKVFDVQVGAVFGDNVLRNVVTVAGGQDINVTAAVSIGAVGYCVFDVEPNSNNQYCDNITCGYIRGLQCSVAGGIAYPIGYVEFARMDLDPAYQVNTTPAYTPFTGLKYQALALRNFKSFKTRHMKVTNHDYAMIRHITNIGDYAADLVDIEYIEGVNNSVIDPTYDYYIVGGGNVCKAFHIGGGNITLQSGKRFVGLVDYPVIERVVCNGTIAYECLAPRLAQCRVDSTFDTYVAGHTLGGASPGATFIGCTITFTGAGIGRLTDYENCTVIDCTVTANNFMFHTSYSHAAVINSTLNGVYYSNGKWLGTGSFTLSAAATKTINNASTTAVSKIRLIPTNAAAATLMQSTKSLYLSARTAGVSFVFSTADGTNAAGTETFEYTMQD